MTANPSTPLPVVDRTTASDEEWQAELARIEAADVAPEAHETVDRVMQAIWEAADGYMCGVPWERAKANPFKEAKAFRQAVAAITALGGAS